MWHDSCTSESVCVFTNQYGREVMYAAKRTYHRMFFFQDSRSLKCPLHSDFCTVL